MFVDFYIYMHIHHSTYKLHYIKSWHILLYDRWSYSEIKSFGEKWHWRLEVCLKKFNLICLAVYHFVVIIIIIILEGGRRVGFCFYRHGPHVACVVEFYQDQYKFDGSTCTMVDINMNSQKVWHHTFYERKRYYFSLPSEKWSNLFDSI